MSDGREEQDKQDKKAPRRGAARLDNDSDLNALRPEAYTNDPFGGLSFPKQVSISELYQATPGEQVRQLISDGDILELCNRARLDSAYHVANLDLGVEFLVQQTFTELLSSEYANDHIDLSMWLARCLKLDDGFVSACLTRLLEQSVEAQPTVDTIEKFILGIGNPSDCPMISPNTEQLSALVKEYLAAKLDCGFHHSLLKTLDIFQINFTHEERVALEPSASRMCVRLINSGDLYGAEQIRRRFDVSDDALVLAMVGQEQLSPALKRAARHFSLSPETLIDLVLAQEADAGVVATRVVELFPGIISQMGERIVSMSEGATWAPTKIAALLRLVSSTILNRPDLVGRACAVILRQKFDTESSVAEFADTYRRFALAHHGGGGSMGGLLQIELDRATDSDSVSRAKLLLHGYAPNLDFSVSAATELALRAISEFEPDHSLTAIAGRVLAASDMPLVQRIPWGSTEMASLKPEHINYIGTIIRAVRETSPNWLAQRLARTIDFKPTADFLDRGIALTKTYPAISPAIVARLSSIDQNSDGSAAERFVQLISGSNSRTASAQLTAALAGASNEAIVALSRVLAVETRMTRDLAEEIIETMQMADLAANFSDGRPPEWSGETLRELRQSLMQGVAERLNKTFGDNVVASEQLATIAAKWGTLEPILTYTRSIASYRSELRYFGKLISRIDAGDRRVFRKHRYDQSDPATARQLAHLNSEQLGVWMEDQGADVTLLTRKIDAGHRARTMQSLAREGVAKLVEDPRRRANPEDKGSVLEPTIARTLSKVMIDSTSDYAKVVRSSVIPVLEAEIASMNSLLSGWSSDQLERAIGKITLGPGAKYKDFIGAVEIARRHLPSELVTSLKECADPENKKVVSAPAEEIIEALEKAVSRQRADHAAALSDRVWTKYGLDPEQPPGNQELFFIRQELNLALTVAQAACVTKKDVVRGLLPGSGVPIADGLAELQEYLGSGPSNFAAMPARMVGALNDSVFQHGSERLLALATDDPQIMLQIGKYPLNNGSCQNYERSDGYNTALPSYMGDAHIKVLILIQENRLPEDLRALAHQEGVTALLDAGGQQEILQACVARAIIRTAPNEAKEACILREPFYTQANKGDASFTALGTVFLKRMLERPMNAKVMRGLHRGADDGGMGEMSRGSVETLSIPASKNPCGQYEDTSGLGRQQGRYSVSVTKAKVYAGLGQEIGERLLESVA